jgi:D-glycero-alpha-D-manno-heptose-7-phosphate kinase
MLITRTPLRISIGGGGTDLPSYYRRRGGVVISAAIDKYIYVAVNRTFTDDYFLKYSAIERVKTVDEIQHALLREALRLHDTGPRLELVSIADIPSGTGLGSSGTFTVGVLKALYALKREHVTAQRLAEEACSIEIDRLGQPVGKQDQYIAAFGGLTVFEFNEDDSVRVTPLAVDGSVIHELEERLLLFFTGYSREASAMLKDQQQKSDEGDSEMIANLDRTKELGLEIKQALEDRDVDTFGKLMHEHWVAKRARTKGMSNPQIDRWYETALANGALGGKIVGAGAGGFLMLLADDPTRVRRALVEDGMSEVRFSFDLDGSTVVTRG